MSFPAYPSYRDSGVEWLGSVPSHWEVAPLKRLLEIRNGADHKHVEQDEGYPVIGSGGPFTFASEYLFDGESVLLGRKGTVDKPLYVTGRFWTVDTMYWSKIRPESHGRFAYYTATTIPFGYYSTNTALPSMTQSALNGHFVARPPLREQIAIAAFLDHETAKIDALIEEQRRLIVLVKEKRQAVISHAVTKGLDPHAPMKDSDIEWLGELPAHWCSAKVKHVCSHVVDCFHTTPTYDGELIYPAIRTADIERGKLLLEKARLVSQEIYVQRIERLRPIANDVLYSREGERFGLAALVPVGVDLCLGQRMMMFRTLPHASSAYLMWALNSDAVYQQVLADLGGATSPHINIGDIINFSIPEPPLEEQRAIAEHIASEVAALDALAEVATTAIALLQERRIALISAAVTGKIDVHGSATVLRFPVDRARARGLVATEIIERSASQATFGRVKFQKIAFLAEGHVGISELAGCYTREAAGPLDRALIDEMESGASSIAGVGVNQDGGTGTTVSYRLSQSGAHREELADWLGADRTAKLDKLIADFAPLTTKQAEAVATLYGVWNDALSEGNSPTDDEIIAGFLNDWHPEKREKFRACDLPEWLGWMRRHGIVPTGSGPKTTTGRLFA